MDQYIGEIRLFAGNYAPTGWALCNGQILPVNGNEALFSLIGTTYGGDGMTNFALPDYRGRISIHQGQNPLTGTNYPRGQKGGSERVTLLENQLPAHTHTVNASSGNSEFNEPSNSFWASAQSNQYSDDEPNQTMNTEAVSNVGGNVSHENMMPTITLSYIIALQGIYPVES